MVYWSVDLSIAMERENSANDDQAISSMNVCHHRPAVDRERRSRPNHHRAYRHDDFQHWPRVEESNSCCHWVVVEQEWCSKGCCWKMKDFEWEIETFEHLNDYQRPFEQCDRYLHRWSIQQSRECKMQALLQRFDILMCYSLHKSEDYPTDLQKRKRKEMNEWTEASH